MVQELYDVVSPACLHQPHFSGSEVEGHVLHRGREPRVSPGEPVQLHLLVLRVLLSQGDEVHVRSLGLGHQFVRQGCIGYLDVGHPDPFRLGLIAVLVFLVIGEELLLRGLDRSYHPPAQGFLCFSELCQKPQVAAVLLKGHPQAFQVASQGILVPAELLQRLLVAALHRLV